jgi:hypothetical protein
MLRYRRHILVRNGVGLRLFREIIRSQQEVSAPLVAVREWSCYGGGYPFEWDPDIILMRKAPTPGSGAAISCAGVARATSLLDVVSCLKPVVPLLHLVQDLIDAQVPS